MLRITIHAVTILTILMLGTSASGVEAGISHESLQSSNSVPQVVTDDDGKWVPSDEAQALIDDALPGEILIFTISEDEPESLVGRSTEVEDLEVEVMAPEQQPVALGCIMFINTPQNVAGPI